MEHSQHDFFMWMDVAIQPYKPAIITAAGLYLTDINTILGTVAALASIGYSLYCFYHKKEEIKNKKNGKRN